MMINATRTTTTQPDPLLDPHRFNAMLWDLLDPNRSAIDIANDYDLSLDELARVLESEQYTRALDAIARINTAGCPAYAQLRQDQTPLAPAHAQALTPSARSHGTPLRALRALCVQKFPPH